MRFVDEVKVKVTAGSGGNGLVGWRREKYVPRGGPDGGDGGNGGAVVLVTDPGLNTLIDFSFSPLLRAEDGGPGGANQRTGRDGKDAHFMVPVGTQVFWEDELVADLSVPGARWVAARGGRGGRGNEFFKTPTNQAPDYAQPGRAGEAHEFRFVLKSVADVGLVGVPNVGKSTLIASISAARPAAADYPFTTLEPHLGVVAAGDDLRFVVADIPGLIPGAHAGRGLGLSFLKHIERTKVIAQLIDVTTSVEGQRVHLADDVDDAAIRSAAIDQFAAIDLELKAFGESVATLPRLVVFSKEDLPYAARTQALTADYFNERALPTVIASAVTGLGLDELRERLAALVAKARESARAAVASGL